MRSFARRRIFSGSPRASIRRATGSRPGTDENAEGTMYFALSMLIFWLVVYNVLVVPILYAGFAGAAWRGGKAREGFLARRSWEQRLRADLDRLKSRDRIVMFHATSVGELLQALPIARILKTAYPNISIGLSVFSASGYNYFKPNPAVDFICYLPLDSYHQAKRFFTLVRPVCWIVSKFDAWPNHLYRCHKEGIPALLTAATLSESSRRIGPVVGSFHKAFYSLFTMNFPIAEPDRERFRLLFPKDDACVVTGDTRFDEVVYRSRGAREKAENLPLDAARRQYFMLASIWESDETVVLPAALDLLKQNPSASVLITPHEPREKFVQAIEKRCEEAGVKSTRYSRLEGNPAPDVRVVIIDTVGILAQLYSISSFAYVGGSFGPGVHNVMEPAILGNPVMFGPRHINSFEALQMKRRGGAFEIATAEQFRAKAAELLTSREYRQSVGGKVKEYVLENVGAAQRTVDAARPLFDRVLS
ncbi:MAG: hypothetical protein GF418_15660 [Chitinivibrionales bacterium]|nr:hypothetical protein [Chitinivibrionales bacterium]MBD3397058.1 hypothetical protein [Chitinivibrionales bacterium]